MRASHENPIMDSRFPFMSIKIKNVAGQDHGTLAMICSEVRDLQENSIDCRFSRFSKKITPTEIMEPLPSSAANCVPCTKMKIAVLKEKKSAGQDHGLLLCCLLLYFLSCHDFTNCSDYLNSLSPPLPCSSKAKDVKYAVEFRWS